LSAGVPRKMKVHRPVTKFAFIIHPLNARDMARKYRWAAWLPAGLIEWLMTKTPVQKISEITGIRSATGAQTTGWFVVCPMTARQLVNSNPQQAIAKIIEAGRMAEQLGAQIVGLGAFTAVVGEGGTEVAEALDIPSMTKVEKIDFVDDETLRVRTKIEHGYMVIETKLPAALAVTKEINEPRIPPVFGALWATEKEIKKWSAEDVGVDKEEIGLSGSPTYVPKVASIEIKRRGEVLQGEPTEIARQLVEKLRADGALPEA